MKIALLIIGLTAVRIIGWILYINLMLTAYSSGSCMIGRIWYRADIKHVEI
jgi:hypothetical protein